MPNTDNIQQIAEQYEDAVTAIQADADLTREAKARRIGAAGEGVVESWGKARKELDDAFESERTELQAKARGTDHKTEPTDTQTELRAMRSELAARDVLDGGVGGAIFEAYEQAIADGDEAAAQVFEAKGVGKLTAMGVGLDDIRRFEDTVRQNRENRKTPEQLEAQNELDALTKRRDTVGMGLSMQQDTLFNRVKMRRGY